MNRAVFDYADVEPLVERFCDELPKLLGRHAATADLVGRAEGLSSAAESPFTVAVVGQMRVGKSTLINALLGKDLAVTGVNETTATINWFRYGRDSGSFRVHWKDRPSELLPLDQINRWTGESEVAAQTRCLEFFDDAPFLRVASLVDTPGLRSVIASHEQATAGFLGTGHDPEGRRLGSRADAIVYVLMPVARQTDEVLLRDFENQTRLPGASAYNSLAVIHKWETLDVEDPAAEAHRKAQKVAEALRGRVCEVIPVSGPLAKAAATLDSKFWLLLARLACESTPAALERCLISDRKFTRAIDGCALSVEERTELIGAGLPWASLKAAVGIARRERLRDPRALRAAVAEAAQLEHLRRELDRRFFSRSRMLKLLSLVSKAWEPCQLAQVRLRQRRAAVTEQLARSVRALQVLEDRVAHGDGDLGDVIAYVGDSREVLEAEQKLLNETLQQLGELAAPVQSAYDEFNADMSGLESLEQRHDQLDPAMRAMIESLFGADGPTLQERLSHVLEPGKPAFECIDVAIDRIRQLRLAEGPTMRVVCMHAIGRLEQMAHQLELSELPQPY